MSQRGLCPQQIATQTGLLWRKDAVGAQTLTWETLLDIAVATYWKNRNAKQPTAA